MKRLLLALVLLLSAKIGHAQVYKINDYDGQSLNVCKGQFTGTNGLNTSLMYANDENYTVTFCSGDPTRKIRANFFYIYLEQNFDFLYVYDGPTATGTPVASLTGYLKFPGVITSTGTCLTFRFISNGTIQGYGWDAFIGCTPVSCGANQPASDECITATPICNLGGYCGSTSGWYTRGAEAASIDGDTATATPFCGTTHNNSWLSFVASTTNASFDITSSNCSDPSQGIQAVIFETNDCSTFLRKSSKCFANEKGNFTLDASGLIIGKKYFIMVDGAFGNDCNYTILAKSGVQTINITASSTNTLCTGQPLVVTANATGVGPFTYKWTPKPISSNSDSSVVTYPAAVGVTYSCSVTGVCGTPASVSYSPSVNTTPKITVTDSTHICTGGIGSVITANSSASSPSIYFTNNVTTSVPDNDVTGITSTIAVGNISGAVGSELQQVCFSISHGSASELAVSLKAPNGSVIDLSSGNGGTGSNYTKTCFSATGGPPITSGTAPFTGTYSPEQSLSGLSASAINGVWGLIVKDNKLNNTGLLTNWSLTFKNDVSYSWTPSTGLTPATGASVTANPSGTTIYTATVTDKAGCSASKPVKVRVTNTPAAPAVTSPVIYCVNATASPLAATGTGLLWYTAATGGTGSSTAPTPITTVAGSFDYYVSQAVSICEGARAKITVVVNSKINASFSYASTGFCQNTSNPFPVIAPGAVAGIFSATPAGLVFVNNTTGEIDLKASIPGTYTIINEIAPIGGCAKVTSTPFTVTIYPEPSLSNASTAQICTGVALNIPLTSTVASSYSWIAADNTNTTGETYTAPKQTAVINDVLLNNTSLPQVVKYTITLTSTMGACVNLKPQTIDVTVNPEPSLTNSTAVSVCSGSPLNIALTSNLASSYSWIAADNANTTGETYTAPKQTTVINDVLLNKTSVPQVVKYTITLTSTANACVNLKPQTIDVTVNPEPSLTNSTAVSVCSGTPLNIALTSNVASSYSWIAGDNANVTGETYTTPKQTAVINDLLLNNTSVPQVVTYTVTITSNTGACLNLKPQTIDVTVNPEPILTGSSTAEICSGEKLNIVLTSNIASGFSWIAADNSNTSGETYTSPKQTAVINDVLVNNSSVPQVVRYTITLTSTTGACVNLKPQTIDVTVNKTIAAFTATPMRGVDPLFVQFTNSSTAANHYSWDFGNGATSSDVNPNYTYKEPGHYQACLMSDDGKCFDKTCVTIEVDIHSEFVIPNVFTPNNDGINDVFTIAGKGIESVHAEIYNRWGQKEYEWNTTNGGWDGFSGSGTPSTSGTYYFMVEIKGMDGKKYSESGSLTLLR
jgi:gliding motility-associated-like protein